MRSSTINEELFASMPVPKAVALMVLPAIANQIVHVIYNISDTWFVGLTGNPDAVAAVSLCMIIFNVLTAISNLFGIGAASVISRSLGRGDHSGARYAFRLSVWASAAAAGIYGILLFFFGRSFLTLVGGEGGYIDYAVRYNMVTVVAGGVPTVLAAVLAHVVRSTGNSGKASMGLTLGAVLNIAFDPLFMFVLLPPGNEVVGAALATAASNIISLAYFLLYIFRGGDEESVMSVRPNFGSHIPQLLGEILKCGLPSFTMIAFTMLSHSLLNATIAGFGGGAAIAGLGIVRKIDSLAFSVNQGVTQGMLPLVGYCFSSGLHERMKRVIIFSAFCTVAFSIMSSTVSYTCSKELLAFFINDPDTIFYGSSFLRVVCLAIPCYSVTFVVIAVFQAVGKSLVPFMLSALHRGTVDNIMLFIIKANFDHFYVIWTSPISEAFALLVSLIMLFRLLRGLKLKGASAPGKA